MMGATHTDISSTTRQEAADNESNARKYIVHNKDGGAR